MKRRGYPGNWSRRGWTCPSCKQTRKGAVCNVCLVKREDAEKSSRDKAAAAQKERT